MSSAAAAPWASRKPISIPGLTANAQASEATAFEDGLFRRGMDEEEMLRYYAGVHAFYAALPADRYPVLASIAPDMTGHDDVERFSFGLDVLISGLEAVNERVRDSGQGVGQGEP